MNETMKNTFLLCIGLMMLTFQSCNYFKSKHPQAGLAEDGSTEMTDKSILQFTAGTDKDLNKFIKEISLVFSTGDLSMYVEKYSMFNGAKLYKTFTTNGITSEIVKSYYFKNDSLILIKEKSKLRNEEGEVFHNVRTYMRNNIIFKIDSRTARSSEAIQKLPYLIVQPAGNKYPAESYTDDIKVLDDAVNGVDKFALVFDNITTYPEYHYINLKSATTGNYKSAILVQTRDSFIDSLLTVPSMFKDQKLKIKWKIVDREAVYVPVADTTTSASGLNR
jgi:hypothetical protein